MAMATIMALCTPAPKNITELLSDRASLNYIRNQLSTRYTNQSELESVSLAAFKLFKEAAIDPTDFIYRPVTSFSMTKAVAETLCGWYSKESLVVWSRADVFIKD